jgi:hypothetical protein
MTSHRATITTLTLLTLALAASLPASASAGSLLSGYGGPGQGSQAILGSALLPAPPSGGAGGGGGAGAEGGEAPPTGTTSTGVSTAKKGQKPLAGRRAGHSRATARAKPSPAYTGTDAAAASQASVGTGPTLGLTGADLLYVLLALGALAMTGALTLQLARKTR